MKRGLFREESLMGASSRGLWSQTDQGLTCKLCDPGTRHLASLSLTFLVYKLAGITLPVSQGLETVRVMPTEAVRTVPGAQ